MSAPAFLPDVSSDQIGIGLELRQWARSTNSQLEGVSEIPHLERSVLCELFILAGEGRISKKNLVLSLEEIIDLTIHVDAFCSRKESSFEWSSVEPTVQMLKVYREESGAHVELLMKLYGFPEGYAGNASLSFQFDVSEFSLKAFHGEIRAQLLRLVGSSDGEKLLAELISELNSKLELMRRRNVH